MLRSIFVYVSYTETGYGYFRTINKKRVISNYSCNAILNQYITQIVMYLIYQRYIFKSKSQHGIQQL